MNKSHSVCIECDALCCRDVTMMITKPKSSIEIDELRWYLHYDTARIFIRNNKWYLSFNGRCRYLDKQNLCSIYSRRPKRCRRHNPPECERYAPWYDVMINSPGELDDYLAL